MEFIFIAIGVVVVGIVAAWVITFIQQIVAGLQGKVGPLDTREMWDDGDETRKFVIEWINKPDCKSITYWVSMAVYGSGDPAIEYFKEQKSVDVKVSEEKTFKPGGEPPIPKPS